MNEETAFAVVSPHSAGPCHERFDDTVIASAPDAIFTDDGVIVAEALKLTFSKILRQCSEGVREHWHHAEFHVTDDPKVVEETIDRHCVTCVAGADQVMTFLQQNPGKKLIVGRIWWVL